MAMTKDEAVMLGRIDTNVQALLKRDADKEKRLRAVERKQWAHSGVVVVIAAFFAKLGLPLPLSH